ncbi:hypothetical protein [Paenibacillus taiwanensis]|uniref:hypothetical protein n=1 Tax=Paenibacillus taiwanensis TaxID=401638 RepID=UPI0003FE76B9|nr:hypothetical protein [Paenibacillus taiwanensis]
MAKKEGRQVDKPTYQEPQHEGFSVLNFLDSDHDNLPFHPTDVTGAELDTGIADQDKPEGVLAFVTSGKSLPQSVFLKVDVNRIGNTTGNWKGTIAIEQGKAKPTTK